MDLKNPKWMFAKAVLFLLIGALCFGLLLAQQPTLRTAALLLLLIWAFARAYYFAFYVIERYVDASYRFSGLLACARHCLIHKPWRTPVSGKTPR
jgi:hypothetical protein